MKEIKTINRKAICLVSRSKYPHPISQHSQNMKTFEGWSRFWDDIVIIAQTDAKGVQVSKHKNILGALLPLIKNKYLNVIYFQILGIFQIRKLMKN